MAALIERIPAGGVMKQVTLEVRVTGVTLARLRTWLGLRLLGLAGWIIGCQVEVTVQGQAPEPAPAPSLDIPPVRLSIGEIIDGTAPVPFSDAQRIRLLVDGVEVRHATAYDCEAGWVERHKRDQAGQAVIKGDEIEMERLTGVVTAEYRKAA